VGGGHKAVGNYAERLHKLQLQNWISTPKRKNDDFESLFLKGILKGKSSVPKWEKSAGKAPFATFMQQLQYDSTLSCERQLRTKPQQRGTLPQPSTAICTG